MSTHNYYGGTEIYCGRGQPEHQRLNMHAARPSYILCKSSCTVLHFPTQDTHRENQRMRRRRRERLDATAWTTQPCFWEVERAAPCVRNVGEKTNKSTLQIEWGVTWFIYILGGCFDHGWHAKSQFSGHIRHLREVMQRYWLIEAAPHVLSTSEEPPMK